MDWSDVAGKVIGLGAPILGGALGGPLGAAAGKILADALGAAEPTAAAVNTAIDQAADSAAAAQAARQASLVECPAFALTLLHALWIGHDAGINGFASLSALFMAYFGARFGVLGVYVTGRTREKQAGATGELPPTLIGALLKALANKKK